MIDLKTPIPVNPDPEDNEGKATVESAAAESNGIDSATVDSVMPDSATENITEEKALVRVKTDEEGDLSSSPKRKRKRQGKKGVVAICACLFLAIVIFALWVIYDNNSLEKDFYQLNTNKLTDNVRIVALADLHNKQFGKDNKRLINEVKKLNPDIIAVVGDMMMEQRPDKYETALSLCEQLESVAPVYYSLGNHEIDAMLFGHSNIYKDAKSRGIKILNNEVEQIDINGSKIDVIGLTQNPTEFPVYGLAFFEKAMKADDNFKLVLNHYPEQFLGTLDNYDIDLAIAGHAHGGLVRLPFIGGLYSADQGLFPKLYQGYHAVGNSNLIISRGLGKSGIVPRINNTPEITVVDLSWY